MQRAFVTTGLLILVLLAGLAGGRAPALRGATDETRPPNYLPLIARGGPTPTGAAAPSSTALPGSTTTPTLTPEGPCASVYPIAIGAALLDANGFVPPTNPAELPYYLPYSDATYANKTQRRIYQDAATSISSYHFLVWTNAQGSGSSGALAAALSDTGTLAQGFDEVTPWPDRRSASPTGYPLYPHHLNPGDWLRIFTSSPSSAASAAALTAHVVQKTVMSLPIVDQVVTAEPAASAHQARLGNFLLRGFSLADEGLYLDLVYLEDAVPQLGPPALCS